MEENRIITGDNAWMYNPPVNINAYNTTATNETSEVQAAKEAEWKRTLNAIKNFNGVCTVLKDLIIYEEGEDVVVAIKKKSDTGALPQRKQYNISMTRRA